MVKIIENYILTGVWVMGLLLAGADGSISPLVNLAGAGLTIISSWLIYNRAYLSPMPFEDVPLRHEEKNELSRKHRERALDRHGFYLRD